MSFDDDQPGAHHIERMTVERRFDRGVHHAGYETEQVRYLEDLAEQIAAVEDELAHLRARYEQVDQWRPEPSSRPSDLRGVKSAGTDEREEWREVS